jgi:hypothetical protein
MMKYLFELEQEPLNPVNLEKELGFKRGTIERITVYPEGAVEVDGNLSTSQQDKVKQTLAKRGLPKGKRATALD